MKDPIAERQLLYSVKGSDVRQELVICVGRPYWLEDHAAAACPIEWSSIYEELPDPQGADLLQALQLAADIDPWLDQLSKKYDFFFPNGDPYHDQVEG